MSVVINGFRHRLRLVGAVLLLCAVVVPLALASLVLGGADAQPETYVAGDGVEQVVEVPGGRPMMIWLDETIQAPRCAVRDDVGRSIELESVSDAPRKNAGTAGDWVGTYTFETSADSVRVSCQGVGRPPMGPLLTPAPGLLSGLSGIVVLLAASLALAAVGLLCIARGSTRPEAGSLALPQRVDSVEP